MGGNHRRSILPESAQAFALFLDGPENWIALPWIGKMVAAIAQY